MKDIRGGPKLGQDPFNSVCVLTETCNIKELLWDLTMRTCSGKNGF